MSESVEQELALGFGTLQALSYLKPLPSFATQAPDGTCLIAFKTHLLKEIQLCTPLQVLSDRLVWLLVKHY